ncbi:MAG: tRNA (cytidine(34)-2'-O)-methyltransferase [Chlamydiae bacterium]|nr:tRNA (cytidine(34)-2'-O)-methyltransferase [Chlamydiota bacterium]
MNHNIEIILFQPQIPQNTGNILRTCAVSGCSLTLITPLGFQTNDRWLKRAGLDYWDGVNVTEIENLRNYLNEKQKPFYFFTSKAEQMYDEVVYPPETQLVFGSETFGLPDWVIEEYPERCVQIPMIPNSRCLNLATSVGIGLYEAIRQLKA